MNFQPWRWIWLPALLLTARTPSQAQTPPGSGFDARLESTRKAAAAWELRPGPDRTVVDQVCLVPDLPTFLEAVASWDETHFFPVLFDDVESSFRFIRAFKPSRIVRMPRSAPSIPEGKLWDRAIEAVGASWTSGKDKLDGGAIPKTLGPTPPGLVVSHPSATMLAGAVALAAGRFQPLVRLEDPNRFGDVLTLSDAESFSDSIQLKVREQTSRFADLGDDCDFLTIAGDYPYRYRDGNGEEAIDDKVGRASPPSNQRWAFAGRLLGDPVESVYRAMASLFLQPESALMFNGYDESAPPWSNYTTRGASIRLSALIPTSQVAGEKQANLEGWHETFDPNNRFGLILLNSHGSPTEFNIRGGPAHAPDIPRSIPSAVLMIHSFSAARPDDPSTVAGRWLANGAFVFFGSMNEPFLDAFRTPRLVSELIAQRWPLVVAVRETISETRGQPWRLVFLGDPLYRIKSRSNIARVDRWEPTVAWPSYAEGARPAGEVDLDLFFWSMQTAMTRLQRTSANGSSLDDLSETLLAIRRSRLPTAYRPILDGLLTEVLLQSKKRGTLKARLLSIPDSDRSPGVRRTIETLVASDLSLSLARQDFNGSKANWLDAMKLSAVREFKQQATHRVSKLADTPSRLADWRTTLRSSFKGLSGTDLEIVTSELKRVDDATRSRTGR